MHRARLAVAVTALAAFAGVDLIAQTPQAPPMTSVLAGKKLTPPIRGEAIVEWVEAPPNRVKDMVITKIQVRNAAVAPIARFTINETWYDKAGATVTAGRGVINGLLQPGEIQTITIETPWKAGMSGFQRQFTHANGTIKQVKVKQLQAPAAKEPAATPASTTKKP
jgi:hypothetical protein